MDLDKRTAIVTGAGRGIGFAVADELAQAGATVVVNDISGEVAEAAAEKIVQSGGVAVGMGADVSDPAAVQDMFDNIGRTFDTVDVLVNNAGILVHAPILEHTVDAWDRTMAVNARGAFLCAQAAATYMVAQGRGVIVNIASISARVGTPTLAAYSASKFAVIGLTQVLAQELGREGVRCNAVCPGLVPTDMLSSLAKDWGTTTEKLVLEKTSSGAAQSPKNIAEAVLFLVRADAVNGQALNVCGGIMFD